jgi:peptidoglycan/xylan/chitin deacetylase (PgdA/CDA1 family)
MLPASRDAEVNFGASFRPRVLVIVDAEEEFDWSQPFSQSNTRVASIAAQKPAEKIFSDFGIVPTYVVDYAVASQPSGYEPLRDLLKFGGCEIGAQLHPWVTPPIEEQVSEKNSYANNLPASLERRKIITLTETIERNFGSRPTIYRAGRYGSGAVTLGILEELGYQVDCSVLPGKSLHPSAPDYSGGTARPYWLNSPRQILEIPVTIGTVGLAGGARDGMYRRLASPLGNVLKMPAFAARLGLVERIRLTPEGSTLEEGKRLTRAMLNEGHRVFVVSYHSPSLEPGNTPYVRDRKDLQKFLDWLRGYFEFFMGEVHGLPSTPPQIRTAALNAQHVRCN